VKLEEALVYFLNADHSPETRETYRKFLSRFVAAIGPARPLDLVRPEDLDAYVTEMRRTSIKYATHPKRPTEKKPLASATVYKRIKMIKRFFNWCVEREYLTQSPGRFLVNKRPVRPLGQGKAATDAEVSAILGAARYKARDWAIVSFLVQSGCRAGELARMRIDQIEGKGDRRRILYFGPEAAEAVRAWLECRPGDADHNCVFTSTRGHGPLSAQSVSQVTRRLCKVSGLKRSLGAHAFRHYVAMTLARNGVPAVVIQAYLGHTDVSTTMGYLSSIGEADLRAAGRFLSLVYETEKPAASKLLQTGLNEVDRGT
jgi:integrase/recombinase XerC